MQIFSFSCISVPILSSYNQPLQIVQNLHNLFFKLYLHTKLSNPHYPPEVQAEAALINFSVTMDGLEDQLLNMVVKEERPDLAAESLHLIEMVNLQCMIKMQLSYVHHDIVDGDLIYHHGT